MTYPPPQGGQPDPYGQQPGYGPPPVTPASPGPYGQPASPGPYGQPAYAGGPQFGGQPMEPAGERPGKLTVGAMMMLAIAALSLLSAIVAIVGGNQMEANAVQYCEDVGSSLESAYGTSSGAADSCKSQMEGASSNPLQNIGGFFWLVAFSVAAIFVLQGQNWARIVGFVLNSLNLVCSGIGAILMVVMMAVISEMDSQLSSQASGSGADLPSAADIIPGWFIPVAIGVPVITMILSIVSIILMANKESGNWLKAKSQGR